MDPSLKTHNETSPNLAEMPKKKLTLTVPRTQAGSKLHKVHSWP